MSGLARDPLWVEELEIRHFAGIRPNQSFKLENLSAGINLIYGPNGCGKSTTARAVQHLLWPDAKAAFSELSATVRLQESRWTLITRGREVRNLDGSETQAPPVWAAPETRMRYNWSLQNLLQEQDGDLARQIAREMAGGVDFTELASALNWEKRPSSPSGIHKQFLTAEKKLRDVRNTQQALKQESLKLADLKNQCREAQTRAEQAPVLEQAIELSVKTAKQKEVREALSLFPPCMPDLLRDDADELQNSLNQKQKIHEELQSLRKQQAALGPGEEDWGTVGEGDFQTARRELEHLSSRIEELERDCREAEKEFQSLETEQRQLHTSLGIHAKAVLHLEDGFEYPEIQAWTRQIFKVTELRERGKLLEETLSSETPSINELYELDLLRDARRCLEEWIQVRLPPKAVSLAGFITNTLLLAALWVYLIVQKSFPVYPGLLILPGILLQIFFQHRKDEKRALELRSKYPQKVPPPPEWTENTVREHLGKLDEWIRTAKAEEIASLDRRRLTDLQNKRTEAEKFLNELKERLQASGLDVQSDPLWMAHFLQTVQSWRELRRKTKVAEDFWNARIEEKSKAEEALQKQLQHWGHRDPALSLKVAVENLTDRIQKELSRRNQLAQLELNVRHLQQQLSEREAEITKRCQRVDLHEPDVRTLIERVNMIDDWEIRSREAEALEARISELRITLKPDLETLPAGEDELRQQREACADAAEEERTLREQITRLEERIDGQRRGRDVHEAEESLEICREEISNARASQAEVLTGMAVLDWLQEQCRSRDRSKVLEEANRNLGIFSKGNLQLHLSRAGSGEEFTASAAGSPPQPLERLSSGERTQLLMAVRLAFLRLHEHAPLPLLVDEALGTTDDIRGEELIRALIGVSRQGRQLFYFTAQLDEVQKWRQVMSAMEAEGNFVDLAALRSGSKAAPLPAMLPEKTAKVDVSRQPDESDFDWASRLKIPGWHPREALEDLSLWYLLQEDQELLQSLFQRGINTVGHWLTYSQAGGLQTWIPEQDLEKVNQRIEVLRALQEAWQIGRPAPVSISEVLMSGAVTEKFTEGVSNLLDEVNGDAAALIQGLHDRKVPGFYKQKISDLEAALHDQGYLTDQTPLSEDEIKARVLALPAAANLDPQEWRQVTDFFFGGAGLRKP